MSEEQSEYPEPAKYEFYEHEVKQIEAALIEGLVFMACRLEQIKIDAGTQPCNSPFADGIKEDIDNSRNALRILRERAPKTN